MDFEVSQKGPSLSKWDKGENSPFPKNKKEKEKFSTSQDWCYESHPALLQRMFS